MTQQDESRRTNEREVVHEQLLAAALRDPANHSRLQQAVCAFTIDCKSRGDPVERVIVELKQTIANFYAAPMYSSPSREALTRAKILEAAVRWCIERYFDDAE